MNKRFLPIVAVLVGVLPIGNAADLPKEKVIIHDVQFSDPRGNADLVGGNAYDRQSNELGVDKTLTNQADATILPAKAAPLVQFAANPAAIASVSPTSATRSPERLTIGGVAKGSAVISPKRRPSSKLGALVFTPMQRTISYHIIRDTAGHNGTVTASQISPVVQRINEIWGGQANITFGPNPTIDIVTVQTDFGETIDLFRTGISPEEQLIRDAAANPAVSINVYIVHALAAVGVGRVGGATAPGQGNVFVSMEASPLDRNTAHELGHSLGLSSSAGTADYSDSARQYQLMWAFENGGFTIAPSQGNLLNPVGGTP